MTGTRRDAVDPELRARQAAALPAQARANGWTNSPDPDGVTVETTRRPDPDSLPAGTPVLAFGGTRDGRAVVTRTRSEVWQISGQAAVAVEGIGGGIALTHIEVLPTDLAAERAEHEALRERVAALADLLVEQGDEHVAGCMGQADCAACVSHDLRAALRSTPGEWGEQR